MKWTTSILVLVLASFFVVSFAADLKDERINAGGVPIPPTNKEVEAVIDKVCFKLQLSHYLSSIK